MKNNHFITFLLIICINLTGFISATVFAQWDFDDGTKQGWSGSGGVSDEIFWCWDDYVSYPDFPYDEVGNNQGSISFQTEPGVPLSNLSKDEYILKMRSPILSSVETEGFSMKFMHLGIFYEMGTCIYPWLTLYSKSGQKYSGSYDVIYDDDHWETLVCSRDLSNYQYFTLTWVIPKEKLEGKYGGFFIDEVQPIYPKADLFYFSESYSYNSPSISFNLSVGNKGKAQAESSSIISFYLSRNADLSDLVKIGETTVSALHPNTVAQVNFSTDLSGYTGTYYVGFILDSHNDVDEEDFANNICIFDSPIDFGGQKDPTPDIQVDDTGVWFYSTTVGNTQYATITVSNTGDADLQINTVSMDDSYSDSDQFGIENTIDSEIISPGNSIELTFSFTPTSMGYKTAKVEIYSNDPDENLVNIYLHANSDIAGNMVTNGGFTNNLDDWSFVTLEAGQATASVSDGIFHAQIENRGTETWNVHLNQLNLTVEQGKTYTASFEARAENPRDIFAFVGMSSGSYEYYNQDYTFSLTTDWQTCTFTFTMTYPTDAAARIGFDIGASDSDVYLDNVSLVDEGSAAPQEPEGNMTRNWTFANGTSDWELRVLGSAQADGSVVSGAYKLDISTSGANTWDVSLNQTDLCFEQGKIYTVSFDAHADGPFTLRPLAGMDKSPYTVYGNRSAIDVTTSPQTYSFTFTMNEPTDASARIAMDVGTSQGAVYLDNITCIESGATAVTDEKNQQPDRFRLYQNYPNPFNNETTIQFQLPAKSFVKLSIFNLMGKKITTLIKESRETGVHTVTWDGKGLPSGLYFYRLKTGDIVETRKLVLQK